MSIDYQKWVDLALSPEEFPHEEAVKVLTDPNVDIVKLASAAGEIRMKYFGKKVKIHRLNNIQNGLCPEDCGYCGQSKDAEADIKKYGMKSADEIIAEAKEYKAKGISRYCMAASGRGPSDKQVDALCDVVDRIKNEVGLDTCLSFGLVNKQQAKKLKDAGLDRLNHNLNTSESHTPNIVNTHTYQDRVDTLDAAAAVGLDSCSGMIAGMGESAEDVLEVAYELRKRRTPSIPINFLVPIEGNRVFDFDQLNPAYCLRMLCVYRFINPDAEIRMGGGREGHLRGLQSLALYPSNSLFIEGYLVTRGSGKDKTYRMIEDAGFEIEGEVANSSEKAAEKFAIDGNHDPLDPEKAHIQLSASPCSGSGSCDH